MSDIQHVEELNSAGTVEKQLLGYTSFGEENVELGPDDTLETIQHEIEAAITVKNNDKLPRLRAKERILLT